MSNDISLGLSFDDVLLVPRYSKISSRKSINLTTNFSRNLKLNIPIVSANMDTVTESTMAIALAREGGIGIIHRFISTDIQVAEVQKVKRAENLVISDPVTINKEASLKDVLSLMLKHGINGILVVDNKGLLEGIITSRDVRFRSDLDSLVEKIMTPRSKLITADVSIKPEEAIKFFSKYKIEKLPLVDKKGKLQGLITASDFLKIIKHQLSAKDKKGRLLVGAAIGVKDGLERSEKLIRVGVDALVIDIAHGHHKTCINLVKALKKKHKNVDVVAGNIATADGAKDLIAAGADAIKIGIGPGAVCSTRIVAGAGIPQVTAIMETSNFAKKYNVPVIADGGIRNSGDLAKAMAAGASSAMIGSLFAGTKESPGEYFIENGGAVKVYRGLASRDASMDRNALEKNIERQERAPEGVTTRVNYKGEVKKIIQNLIDGLQSGMSYSGAENIKEFWQKAKFIKITEAGIKESQPHGLN